MTIENAITEIWENIDHEINVAHKTISSEKSVVYNFAWQFNQNNHDSTNLIDFETCKFVEFPDGQFLDLYIEVFKQNELIRIGIEFKFPQSKINNKGKKQNSGQTQNRQKIINDLKRLNWLVQNNHIDIGCFLCLTNENPYLNSGKIEKFPDCLTYHGKEYYAGTFLPETSEFQNKIKLNNDIKFSWKNIAHLRGNKVMISHKFAFLNPIFIYK